AIRSDAPMARDQGEALPPPSDLANRRLDLRLLASDTRGSAAGWRRIGKTARSPVFFSNHPGWRFSSPDLPGTLYLAESPEVCFWEVFWDDLVTRAEAHRALDLAKVAERSIWTLQLPARLRVVDTFDAATLREIGAHGGTFSGPYRVCQAWAKALRQHPERPDGILYESVRHRGGRCLALFAETCEALAWEPQDQRALRECPELAALLLRYRLPVLTSA
ncbi:MAG TPA: RES family NAD+ phosphorylase, partial [Candidatus Synoicihabitans sp.]|nr:RES family NAD+ phosphorylase [Candidatus Synoicihabitans sp.]